MSIATNAKLAPTYKSLKTLREDHAAAIAAYNALCEKQERAMAWAVAAACAAVIILGFI